jgi:hypothetical protein
MSTSPDYKKTLELLHLFNKVVSVSYLQKDFYFQGKNLLASFQMGLFSDLKRAAGVHNRVGDRATLRVRFQGFIVQLTLLLWSCLSLVALKLRNREYVFIYSIDLASDKRNIRDVRVGYLYDYLKQRHLPVFEVMHTIPSSLSLKRIWQRKEAVMYLESVNFFSSLFSRKKIVKKLEFSQEMNDNKLLNELLNKYLMKVGRYRTSYKFWTFIFGQFHFSRFVGIEDMRYIWEVLLPFQSTHPGTQSLIFQHGHYTKYHPGFLKMQFRENEIIKPNQLVVWNEYWKKEPVRLGSFFAEEQIIVGGEKLGVKHLKTADDAKKKTNHYNLLIPYETDAPKAEVKKYFDKFLFDGHTIYFKLRKDMEKGQQLEHYLIDKNFHERFITIFDESEVVHKIDFVAGVYSTYMYDMLYLQKPTLILETSMDYGEGMITNGLALRFGIQDNLDRIEERFAESTLQNVKHLLANVKYVKDSLDDILRL